jgi:hypothetical protein
VCIAERQCIPAIRFPLLAANGLLVDPCADADNRSNVFTADKNWIETRIADKTADTSLKLLKSIPVFYYLDKSVV